MVQGRGVLWALYGITHEDSIGIRHEIVVSIDSDTDGVHHNGSLHLIATILNDRGIAGYFDVNGLINVLTLSALVLNTIVRQSGVLESLVGLPEHKTGGDRTTVAAISVDVFTSAVEELLLTEGFKIIASYLVGTLEHASGSESPARATIPLVHGSIHSTLFDPIDACRQVGNIQCDVAAVSSTKLHCVHIQVEHGGLFLG